MAQLARSLQLLLIAVFVAATMAAANAPMKAEAAVTMGPMTMGSGVQDCPKCTPQMILAASCDLGCGLSMIAVLADTVDPTFALTICEFELANATASGRVPPPAFTPPRTIILI